MPDTALSAVLLGVQVLLLCGVTILLHALRHRLGTAPLHLFLGGLYVLVQTAALFRLEVPVPVGPPIFHASMVLFPPLLGGLLLVYILDGTAAAQRLILGVTALAILYMGLRFLVHQAAGLGRGLPGLPPSVVSVDLRSNLASIVALLADLVTVAIVYQGLRNLLQPVPVAFRSVLSVTVATIVALQVDALLYPLLAGLAQGFDALLESHILGKAIAGMLMGLAYGAYVTWEKARGGGSAPERGVFHLLHLRRRLALAESELAASQTRFRDLLDALPDGAVIIHDERYLYLNQAYAAIRGRPIGELRGTEVEPDLEPGRLQSPPSGASALFTAHLMRPDGEQREVEVHVTSVAFEGQEARLALLRDRSEARLLEAQLQTAQRLEALGTLAGGIAHDFRNILSGVLGYASTGLRDLPDEGDVRDSLERIAEAARRGGDLASRLLLLVGRPERDPGPVEVGSLLERTRELVPSTLGREIGLHVEYPARLPVLWGFEGELQQALINLALNARDAMPGGGSLWIRARQVSREEWRHLRSPTCDLPEGPGDVLLEVQDEGHGIPRWAQPRIFDPFFTTRERRGGTGLGLSMVHGCVRSHRGAITVESEPGQGTRFCIYLPGSAGPATSLEDAGTPAHGTSLVGKRVLHVEDEEHLRRLMVRMLQPHGVEVHSAADGEEAMTLWEREGPFDLIILDMVMPRMSGEEVLAWVRARDPGVPALFTSGYRGETEGEPARPDRHTRFLPKPFPVEELLEILRDLL